MRVGHPSIAPFLGQDGFVDLSGVDENAFDLHTFAISRARFMVAVSSGPLQIASSLGTPAARANSITPAEVPGAWNDHDLVLHRNLFLADGTHVPVEDALAAGFFDREKLLNLNTAERLMMVENFAKELMEVTQNLHEQTLSIDGWRELVLEPNLNHAVPNRFSFPIKNTRKVAVVEYPDLARAGLLARIAARQRSVSEE